MRKVRLLVALLFASFALWADSTTLEITVDHPSPQCRPPAVLHLEPTPTFLDRSYAVDFRASFPVHACVGAEARTTSNGNSGRRFAAASLYPPATALPST